MGLPPAKLTSAMMTLLALDVLASSGCALLALPRRAA